MITRQILIVKLWFIWFIIHLNFLFGYDSKGGQSIQKLIDSYYTIDLLNIHYYFVDIIWQIEILTLINTVTESPGKVYGEFVKEMLRSHNELSDYNRYMKDNLSKLQEGGIVSENDARMINPIIDVITSHEDFEEKAKKVIEIYKQILSENSGPLARVISCIAADSAQNKYERPKSKSNIKSGPVLEVNVSGALIGAYLGINAGGIKGAILGALIGGSVASLII